MHASYVARSMGIQSVPFTPRAPPTTAVLFVFEMPGSYRLVLRVMMSGTVAHAIARRWRPMSIYEALLNQDGVFLPARERQPHPHENLQVADAMTAGVLAAAPRTTVAEADRKSVV